MVGLAWVGSAHAASLWEHNGSTVYLESSGSSRKFYYEAPRAGLSVKRGTLLFNGVKNGDQYSGTAYVFSKECGPIGYSVSGTVSTDQRSVTMIGKAPRRDANCRVVGYRDDELVFTFQDSPDSIEPTPKKVAVTLGRDAYSLHLDYHGRTIHIEFDGHYVEHDWYALEDMFTQDKRLKTFVILGRTTGIRNAFAMIHSDGRRYVVLDTERDGHVIAHPSASV